MRSWHVPKTKEMGKDRRHSLLDPVHFWTSGREGKLNSRKTPGAEWLGFITIAVSIAAHLGGRVNALLHSVVGWRDLSFPLLCCWQAAALIFCGSTGFRVTVL